MNKNEILPVLDLSVLQEKANDAAMKGAIKSIEEFYSGWDSPYRKAIDKRLSETEIGFGLSLPDIVAVLNDSLSAEIDAIANTAISKTFIPMVQRFLVREKSEMKFSEILKEFVDLFDFKNTEECSVSVKSESKYGWLNIDLTDHENNNEYKLTFHENHESKKEPNLHYSILSLPHNYNSHRQMMKLTVDNATLELPFTRDILQDRFISFIARLIIAKTKITMDVEYFTDEMFPEPCHCD